jgi:signal-transduction protein with cAMP-binding, CBS, and nucleotidyltransferase domain
MYKNIFMKNDFLKTFCEKQYLTDENAMELLNNMDIEKYHTSESIVSIGDFNNNLYIVKSGAVRGRTFYAGKASCCFFFDIGDSFLAPFSYVANRPAKIAMEAVNDVEVYAISKHKLKELCFTNINIAIAYTCILQSFIYRICKKFFVLCR